MLLRSILFTGAVQGLFQILVLHSKNKNHPADYWLMGWLSLVSMQLLFYYNSASADPLFTGVAGIIAFSIPLLSAPVLFQYIRSISSGKKPEKLTVGIYLLPWVMYLAITITISLLYPSGILVNAGYPHFTKDITALAICFFTYPLALLPGVYAILGLVVLLRYQKSLPDKYSYTEQINLNWLKWLVVSILVLFVFLFMFIRFGIQIQLVSYDTLFLYVGAVLSIYVFLIGYLGMRQNTLLLAGEKEHSVEIDVNQSVPYQKTGLSASSVDEMYVRLLDHMQKERPYLRDDLSLAMLAQEMELNTNQLSQVINQKSQRNFFSFVNSYRVEAVKSKLVDGSFSHLSILGMAYDCGFRSKSAFNRIFREHTGMSPVEFQKQHLSQD